MRHADNDNTNPWSSIGLQAALIVNKLRVQAQLTEKQNPSQGEQRPANDEKGNAAEKRPAAHSEYVDQRLREIAAFERRASGKK
jgi:hypothetical protein